MSDDDEGFGPWPDEQPQDPVQMPCDNCGRDVREHTGPGMKCPTTEGRCSKCGATGGDNHGLYFKANPRDEHG